MPLIHPYKIYNIGNHKPEKLMYFVETLEKALSLASGKEVIFQKEFELMKQEDVPITYASTDLLHKAVGFQPNTSIEQGVQAFADWYVGYYKIC